MNSKEDLCTRLVNFWNSVSKSRISVAKPTSSASCSWWWLWNNFSTIFFLNWANQSNAFIVATSRALVCLSQEVTRIVDTSGESAGNNTTMFFFDCWIFRHEIGCEFGIFNLAFFSRSPRPSPGLSPKLSSKRRAHTNLVPRLHFIHLLFRQRSRFFAFNTYSCLPYF